MFFQAGLDGWNRVDLVEEIRLGAQRNHTEVSRVLSLCALVTYLSQVQIQSPRIPADSCSIQPMSAAKSKSDIACHHP